jgi:hypothetical protein
MPPGIFHTRPYLTAVLGSVVHRFWQRPSRLANITKFGHLIKGRFAVPAKNRAAATIPSSARKAVAGRRTSKAPARPIFAAPWKPNPAARSGCTPLRRFKARGAPLAFPPDGAYFLIRLAFGVTLDLQTRM